jgi:hypothetical protein
MSLIKTVVGLIRERGASTVDDLMPLLPGVTRKQAMYALHNAKTTGWLDCTRGRGIGGGNGSAPGTFTARAERIRADRDWRASPGAVRKSVVQAVAEIGEATVDQIYERVRSHGFTPGQIRSSVWNAAYEGSLESSKKRGMPGPTTYRVGKSQPKVNRRRAMRAQRTAMLQPTKYASVFHYGQGIAVNDSGRKAA